jgi:hypothetical protein
MAWDELGRDAKQENQRDTDKWVGVYIGVLALILAVCSLGGGNASKDATMKNIEASNTWAFFQAKNMRRHVIRMQIDELTLALAANPALPADAKTAYEAKLKQYREQEALLTSDPKTNEGLDELFKRAKALEEERDVAMRKDPYFDYGQALLQIAIVLASVAIISGGSALVAISLLFGLIGSALTLNGFMLLLAVPGIG